MDTDVVVVAKAITISASPSPGLGDVAGVLEDEFGWTLEGDDAEVERLDLALRKGMLQGYWSYEPATVGDVKRDQDGRYVIQNFDFHRLGDGFEPQMDAVRDVVEKYG